MTDQLPPQTHPGPVRLVTPNLERAAAFYENVLGFQRQVPAHAETSVPVRAETSAARTARFTTGQHVLLELVEIPGARSAPAAPGLYHFAVLLPNRAALGAALRRLLQMSPDSLEGAADHGVSEAIYLRDPDGNGIELYRDRPRAEWPFDPSGEVRMTTDPLDLPALLADAPSDGTAPANPPPATAMGHVHLQVHDIPTALDFYTRVLGLSLMQRFGPSAAFVSAGGYHHHIGMNTWHSRGASPAPEGSAGLSAITLLLPNRASLDAAAERLIRHGAPLEPMPQGIFTRDPSGNRIELALEPDEDDSRQEPA